MIKLTAITLKVKKIRQGRYGDFCVADLSTEIGDFKVKDPRLDQFEDGDYTGTVWISEIYLAQYIAWGKGVTEIRARLHDLQLDGVKARSPDTELPEPDPAEEVPAPPARRQTPEPVAEPERSHPVASSIAAVKQRLQQIGRKPSKPEPEPQNQDDQLAQLFGDMWPLVCSNQPVKFDPTVDRLILRQQTEAIKKLGYRFLATEQTWYPV